MPSEDLVERVARAICDMQDRPGAYDDLHYGDDELDAAEISVYRQMAEAAIAAMPKTAAPVGWGTLYADGDLAWTTDQTDAGRAWAADGCEPYPGEATVVALVPVEVPDAAE